MNRPRSAAVATGRATAGALIALITVTALSSCLSSCATFNRNDVAAKLGDRSLSAKAAETLAAAGKAATGDQLREELTKWIRVSVLEASSGTPRRDHRAHRCGSRRSALAGDGHHRRRPVADNLRSGSQWQSRHLPRGHPGRHHRRCQQRPRPIEFGHIVRRRRTSVLDRHNHRPRRRDRAAQDGSECIDPAAVNPNVITALKGTPIGQPIAASLDTFSAVLMLRPFDDLLFESKSKIAGAVVSQDQLDTLVSAADIYVDPRYGRWDPDSGAVVTLTS